MPPDFTISLKFYPLVVEASLNLASVKSLYHKGLVMVCPKKNANLGDTSTNFGHFSNTLGGHSLEI